MKHTDPGADLLGVSSPQEYQAFVSVHKLFDIPSPYNERASRAVIAEKIREYFLQKQFDPEIEKRMSEPRVWKMGVLDYHFGQDNEGNIDSDIRKT